MATVLSEEVQDAAARAAGTSPDTQTKIARSEISAKMLGAVKGHAYKRPVKNAQAVPGTNAFIGGTAELSDEEEITLAMRAEKELRASIKRSIADPEGVRKSLNPSFVAEFPLFATNLYPQDPAITTLQQQMASLYAELGKNFTVGNSGTIGTQLVPFDLEAPSHLIYWFDTPLRAKLPRLPGRGSSHRTKVITAISGSQTGASQGIVDPTISEITSFANWPNGSNSSTGSPLGVQGSQNGVDANVAYRFLGMNENLSWLAQFSGVGFEDVTALANLVLMQEMYFAEEYLNIAGTASALAAPTTVTATARTAGSGETAVSNANGTHNWVAVTSKNYYGETVATASTDLGAHPTTAEVVDVVITPPSGQAAQQYNIYFQIGATAFARGSAFYVTSIGGTKYTLQGAMPTSGNNPPASDSGTSGSNRWEGLLSTISGHTAGANGYPSGWQGSYVNTNVQNTLNLTVLNTALQQMYNAPNAFGTGAGAYRASPEELICDGLDSKNLSQDVAKNSSGTNYQLLIQQGEMAGVLHGTAVSQIVNPVTRRIVNVTVHPGWLQGTAVLTQWTTPNAARNSNVFELRMVQDLLSVAWPVIDPTYRFSMFEYGTFFAQAPQYAGLLGGLQAQASNPWS
jgi:hypothetical protein